MLICRSVAVSVVVVATMGCSSSETSHGVMHLGDASAGAPASGGTGAGNGGLGGTGGSFGTGGAPFGGTGGTAGSPLGGAGGSIGASTGGVSPGGAAGSPFDTDAGPAGVFVDNVGLQGGGCLAVPLASGGVAFPCILVEASTSAAEAGCALPGRKPIVSAAVRAAVVARMQAVNICGDGQTAAPNCSLFTVCEIETADASCLTTTPDPAAIGWCYVDPQNGFGDPALVAHCPATEPREIRFVGANTPISGADVLIACASGASL